MRTIMQLTVSTNDGRPVSELISASLAEYGWTLPDLGLERDQLATLARAVISSAQKAGRDLPVSPESQYIQKVIDNAFPVKTTNQESPQQFIPFSFERHCLEQSLLILTQIPESERQESFQRNMVIIRGPEFAVYGIVFGPLQTAASGKSSTDAQTGTEIILARLRCADLERLQKATVSFVSAMNPGRRQGAVRTFTSRGASIGRRAGVPRLFDTEFSRLEIRSVTNEDLFKGRVIPVKGRLALLRQTISDDSARLLTLVSVILIGISALLYFYFPTAGWWEWTEQLIGRLATGAFGALLVNGAIDYTALRKSLLAGSGPVTHGALIEWKRTNS
jgi:hypothetical protein